MSPKTKSSIERFVFRHNRFFGTKIVTWETRNCEITFYFKGYSKSIALNLVANPVTCDRAEESLEAATAVFPSEEELEILARFAESHS